MNTAHTHIQMLRLISSPLLSCDASLRPLGVCPHLQLLVKKTTTSEQFERALWWETLQLHTFTDVFLLFYVIFLSIFFRGI